VRFALKTIVGVFAVLGAAYVAFGLYAMFFLPHCMFSYAAQATSPTGQYSAVYQQSICEDPERSRSEVLIGKRGVRERIVALEIRGTTQVNLTWADESKLFVSYPTDASVKELGPYEGWPRVILRKVERP
jgi:hypothetical protein